MRSFIVVLALLPTVACVPAWRYSALANHTLRVAPDKDTDVVWVEDEQGAIFRCNAGTDTPVCARVKLN